MFQVQTSIPKLILSFYFFFSSVVLKPLYLWVVTTKPPKLCNKWFFCFCINCSLKYVSQILDIANIIMSRVTHILWPHGITIVSIQLGINSFYFCKSSQNYSPFLYFYIVSMDYRQISKMSDRRKCESFLLADRWLSTLA